MSDRGLPVVDGAPACPFVAFADDRDERATSPDHRHRCYAEARPAPRALAHQEAYCLAGAFPVCPTFQDWARREAATARSQPDRSAASPAAAAAAGGAGTAAAALGGRSRDGEGVSAPGFLASRDRAGGGLAGGAAERLASERAAAAGVDQDDDERSDRPATPAPPTRPQGGPPAFAAGAGSSGGSVGSAGIGDAAGAGAGLDAAAAAPGPARGPSGASRDAGSWLDDEVERQDASWDRRPPSPNQAASRPPSRPRRDPNPAPPFERGRRESYPTRRTRTGLRNLSPLALAAIGILALALLLFLAPGFLRNLGSGSPAASQVAGATGSPSATTSASVAPSPSATPAASTYVVQPGDTLSQIAQRFGITLDALIAANQENLPDPDNLQIGNELIIPSGNASPRFPAPAPRRRRRRGCRPS